MSAAVRRNQLAFTVQRFSKAKTLKRRRSSAVLRVLLPVDARGESEGSETSEGDNTHSPPVNQADVDMLTSTRRHRSSDEKHQ